MDLSRGDFRATDCGGRKYVAGEGGGRRKEGGEGWLLGCWLLGWRTWAYEETLARARMREAAARGLTVYTERLLRRRLPHRQRPPWRS